MEVAVAADLVIERGPDTNCEDRHGETDEEEDQPLLTRVAVCRTAHLTSPAEDVRAP